MKPWHFFHLLLLFGLLAFCVYSYLFPEMGIRTWHFNDTISHKQEEQTAFIVVCLVFIYSTILGLRVRMKRKTMGNIWVVICLSTVIHIGISGEQTATISDIEMYPVWLFYLILGIGASSYCLLTTESVHDILNEVEDYELLDN